MQPRGLGGLKSRATQVGLKDDSQRQRFSGSRARAPWVPPHGHGIALACRSPGLLRRRRTSSVVSRRHLNGILSAIVFAHRVVTLARARRDGAEAELRPWLGLLGLAPSVAGRTAPGGLHDRLLVPRARALSLSSLVDNRFHSVTSRAPGFVSLAVGQSVRVGRRSAWSTFPPLCSDQSSAGAVRETVYRRRPGLPGRRTHHLEQPAGQRDICPVSVDLPSASENISVPRLVPGHYH